MSNDNTNVFKEAARRKLRFNTGTGLITSEDLWDLPLVKLDAMAVKLDEGQASGSKSFRRNPDRKINTQQLEDRLRIQVIAEVIASKEDENEAKATAADKKARTEFLERLLEKKRLDQLEGLSTEEIEKELAALR